MPRRVKRALFILIVLALLIVVPPILTFNRFNRELEGSLSRALGREVSFQQNVVYFRLLPQPGFELRKLVIAEDPAFGTEPVLRADTVTAYLRLSSLWRGRLEIARLSFGNPSFNLVRNPEGRWNLESLLQRASAVPVAPTAMRKPQSVLRFPYIEAEDGRINFKLGVEKKAYALLDTDFALWLESPDELRVRIEGRPVRTNAYLTDTGVLRAEASFRRRPDEALENAPFEVHLDLEHGQLGQLTSLFTGRDHGWRANVELHSRMRGSLQRLEIAADAELSGLRRYDIGTSESMRTEIHCEAVFQKNPAAVPFAGHPLLDDLACKVPIRDGEIMLVGTTQIARTPAHSLQLSFRNVPMESGAVLLRRIKLGVPDDFKASGVMNTRLSSERLSSFYRLTGGGAITALRAGSESLDTDFRIGNLDFEVRPYRQTQYQPSTSTRPSPDYGIYFDAFPLRLGQPRPAAVQFVLSQHGVDLTTRGDAALRSLLRAAKTFGLAQRDYEATGSVSFDLAIAGRWLGLASPQITGTAQLRDVKLLVDGKPGPVAIAAARLEIQRDEVVVDRLSASLGGGATAIDGMVRIPRHCERESCASTFDLHATSLDLDDLNRRFNPRFRKIDWLALPRRLIGMEEQAPSMLASPEAAGRLRVGKLTMRKLLASSVASELKIHQGRIDITAIEASLLGGKYHGAWTLDLDTRPPRFAGNGRLDDASLAQINETVNESVGSGTIDGRFELALSGLTAEELARSATGDLSFQWTSGLLRRITVEGAPIHFSSWTGKGKIGEQRLTLASGQMNSNTGLVDITGTIGFDRKLDLRFAGATTRLDITGDLSRPLIAIQRTPAEAASNTANVPSTGPTK